VSLFRHFMLYKWNSLSSYVFVSKAIKTYPKRKDRKVIISNFPLHTAFHKLLHVWKIFSSESAHHILTRLPARVRMSHFILWTALDLDCAEAWSGPVSEICIWRSLWIHLLIPAYGRVRVYRVGRCNTSENKHADIYVAHTQSKEHGNIVHS
jgi:hypothetical protein